MTPTFRFAPSPNGRLHLGHARSALLNEGLARATGGRLLLRIEDIDRARCRPELEASLRADLAWLGLGFDGPVRRQSERFEAYRAALADLRGRGLAYPCFCSRRAVAEAAGGRKDPDGAPLYPGTCRGLPDAIAAARIEAGAPHAWRLDLDRALEAAPGPHPIRRFEPGGPETVVPAEPRRWGDPVIGRRDAPTSYHLAVVLDDADQGVTHVVRGADLLAATDLHVLLQALLGLPSPAYHHHALLRDAAGLKLSKSLGSEALADLRDRGVTPEDIRAALGFDRG